MWFHMESRFIFLESRFIYNLESQNKNINKWNHKKIISFWNHNFIKIYYLESQILDFMESHFIKFLIQ